MNNTTNAPLRHRNITQASQLRRQISTQKQLIREHEIGDDGYYLSRQYQEDTQILYELERALQKLNGISR